MMRAMILFMVFVVSYAVSGVILKKMEAAESSRGEARASETSEWVEPSQMNGAPQYTVVWTSFSPGVF